ncbi:MAG TPA: zf-TFIIB domain-containing protein [Sphingomicrobium sp.]|nr:zf-TFIIB domain-containing protein [Sphingomicrobium sp.]
MANGPMACPTDGTTLVMSERQGIEIDYCPSCRGVWLDRGELDKIIERSSASEAAPPPPPPQQQQHQPQAGAPWGQPPHTSQGYDPRYGHGHKPYKRRKSFLEELFD